MAVQVWLYTILDIGRLPHVPELWHKTGLPRLAMPGTSPSELERIDRALKVQLDVLRHSASTEADILRLIEQMRKDLISKLAQADLTNWSRQRLNTLLRDSEALIASYYTQAQTLLAPTYSTVAGVTAAQTATGIATAASVPSRAVLESLVSNLLIEGATTKAWWAKMSADTAFKFASAVRQGVAQGETQTQIFKRANEVVGLAGRNSAALVHTSVMQVMNDANVVVLEKNADVAPTMRYLATLDSHTCPRCAPRDGLEWDTLTHKPVGHDLAYAQPPIHVGCRCKMIPVTRLTKRADELGIGQRASTFGPVARTTTFSDFLARQSPEWQDSVLGKGRADLYRAGKITLRDTVSGRGAPLTLKQLEARYVR